MNSASRLDALLSAAMGIGTSGPARQVWARVLDVDGDDHASALIGIGHILTLVREVEQDVRRFNPPNKDMALVDLKAIEKALGSLRLAQPWSNEKARFPTDALHGLKYLATVLEPLVGTVDIPAENLAELTRELEELIERTTEAGIDPALKRDVLRYLEYARRALREYRIRGPDGLREAADLNTVLIYRNREVFAAPENESILRLLLEFSGHVYAACSLVGHGQEYLLPAVIEIVIKQLGSG